MQLVNNTGAISQIGYIAKINPVNKKSFLYATSSDLSVIGVVSQSVQNEVVCEITSVGTAKVWVSGKVNRGDTIRNKKTSDGIPNGQAIVVKMNDAPYLQIGYALESGTGLISVSLAMAYIYSDEDAISWTDITDKPTTFPPSSDYLRTSVVKTSDYVIQTTDYDVVANKATAIGFTLYAATGSNRIHHISNIGAGLLTVTRASTDTIDGETIQQVARWETLTIKDYASGLWKIL